MNKIRDRLDEWKYHFDATCEDISAYFWEHVTAPVEEFASKHHSVIVVLIIGLVLGLITFFMKVDINFPPMFGDMPNGIALIVAYVVGFTSFAAIFAVYRRYVKKLEEQKFNDAHGGPGVNEDDR